MLEREREQRRGQREREAGAGEHRADRARRRPGGAEQRERRAPLARRQRERLGQCVEADERVDGGDDAQQRREDPEEVAVARGRPADRRRDGAEAAQARADRGLIGPGLHPDDDLRRRPRVVVEDLPRPDVGDAPVLVERADRPDDAEPRLAAGGQLDRERRAAADPERLREPDADLGLVVGRAPGGRRRAAGPRSACGRRRTRAAPRARRARTSPRRARRSACPRRRPRGSRARRAARSGRGSP